MDKGFVCLLSGGQDSCTALFWALREFGRPAVALQVGYNQPWWPEQGASRRVAAIAKAEWVSETLGAKGIGLRGSDDSYVVPGRNMMMLTLAAAVAQRRGLSDVVFGGCLEDATGFPDCRPAFVMAAAYALRLGLAFPELVVHTPLLFRSKAETVELADELGADCWRALAKTWTCYEPVRVGITCREWEPCGACPACVKRAAGFAEAGFDDPAAGKAIKA